MVDPRVLKRSILALTCMPYRVSGDPLADHLQGFDLKKQEMVRSQGLPLFADFRRFAYNSQ